MVLLGADQTYIFEALSSAIRTGMAGCGARSGGAVVHSDASDVAVAAHSAGNDNLDRHNHVGSAPASLPE
ncbi:hypothetical protein [Dankookia sp. P2]|uniref:hypothetical protein n=1 Tax=Dankookia sp. P2 TaxID=3423955 RepID=UPI003D67CB08